MYLIDRSKSAEIPKIAGSEGAGGTSILGGRGGLAPKFASEIRVRAPNFASKIIADEYPKFCPLNFRYDLKICVVVLETEGNI